MAMKLNLPNIIALTIITHVYVCGSIRSSEPPHVFRDYYDTFESSSCSATHGCIKCNAECASKGCRQCKCTGEYKTYLRYMNRCVRDSELLFFQVGKNSFMINQHYDTLCMTNNQSHGIMVATCNQSDPSQQWIRTWHQQLLHVETLKCIQQNGLLYREKTKWYLSLKECNISETKQKWVCSVGFITRTFTEKGGRKNFVYIIIDTDHTTMKNTVLGSTAATTYWQTKQGNTETNSFCHQAFGCTAMLTLDTNCQRKGIQLINDLSDCSGSSPSGLQYFHDGTWKQFNHTQAFFLLSYMKKNLFLKWNLLTALPVERIFKFNFNCHLTGNNMAQRCVIIKIKKKDCSKSTLMPISFTKSISEEAKETVHISPTPSSEFDPSPRTSYFHTLFDYPSYPTSSFRRPNEYSAFPTSSYHSSSDYPSYPTSSFHRPNEYPAYPTSSYHSSSDYPSYPLHPPSATLSASTSTSMESDYERQKGESSALNIVGLVVGLLIAALVLCGIIIGFVYYRKRRRADKTSSMMDINGKGVLSGDTINPVYSSADKNEGEIYQEPDEREASRTCDLYETADDHEYDYAKVESNKKRPLQSQETDYDYAKNDDIKPASKRLPVKGNNYVDHSIKRASTSISDEKETEIDNEAGPVYQTLENDTQPVYQTLEVE